MSFDLSNESFTTTPIISNIDSRLYIRKWAVLNGFIVWITNYEKTNTFHISILGKVGVKESCIKLMIIGSLSFVEHHIGVGKNDDIFFRKENDEPCRENVAYKKKWRNCRQFTVNLCADQQSITLCMLQSPFEHFVTINCRNRKYIIMWISQPRHPLHPSSDDENT